MRTPAEIKTEITQTISEIKSKPENEREALSIKLRNLRAEEVTALAEPSEKPKRKKVGAGESVDIGMVEGELFVAGVQIGKVQAIEIVKDYYAAKVEAEKILDDEGQDSDAGEAAEAILDKMKS